MSYKVYRLDCTADPRAYVGLSRDVPERFRVHKAAAPSTAGKLYEAMRAHGAEAFSWEIVSSHSTKREGLDAEKAYALSLLAQGRDIFNRTFVAPEKRKTKQNRANPIMVRARKGSALEAAFLANPKAISDLVHKWAEES